MKGIKNKDSHVVRLDERRRHCKNQDAQITGSGDLLVDLGYSKTEIAELTLKATFLESLQDLIRTSKLSQTEVAKRLGIDQPTVSKLLRGQISGFSIERLARYLLDLDCEIHITVKTTAKGNSRAAVVGQTVVAAV